MSVPGPPQHIVHCRCAHRDLVPEHTRQTVLQAIAASGQPYTVLEDLCEAAAQRDERLGVLSEANRVAVVACYPRAVSWLLRWAGVDVDRARLTFHNMRDQSAEEIVAGLFGPGRPPRGDPLPGPAIPEGWVPWFPIIDYDRCRNCKQCLGFCPFGVYALDGEDRVRVSSPRNCKDNCPACARLCPELAIMFPKYQHHPIDGAEVLPEHLEHQKDRSVCDRLDRGNLHQLLADRRTRAVARREAGGDAARESGGQPG